MARRTVANAPYGTLPCRTRSVENDGNEKGREPCSFATLFGVSSRSRGGDHSSSEAAIIMSSAGE
jgi:hypothetical protein